MLWKRANAYEMTKITRTNCAACSTDWLTVCAHARALARSIKRNKLNQSLNFVRVSFRQVKQISFFFYHRINLSTICIIVWFTHLKSGCDVYFHIAAWNTAFCTWQLFWVYFWAVFVRHTWIFTSHVFWSAVIKKTKIHLWNWKKIIYDE